MSDFHKIRPKEMDGNAIQMIAKDWALVTAGDEAGINTMTINWGGLGYLWNKPVAFVFVRPQRHTYGFTEGADGFSVAFFDEDQRKNLQYCGTVSGRDEDKVAHCGYTTLWEDGVPYFAEAKTVLLCKKLYAQDLREGCALSDTVTKQYPEKDYHRMYVAEITQVLVRDEPV